MTGEQTDGNQLPTQEGANPAPTPHDQPEQGQQRTVLSIPEAHALYQLARANLTRQELQTRLMASDQISAQNIPRLLERFDQIPTNTSHAGADLIFQEYLPLIKSKLTELQPEDADDVSQNVFLALWKDIQKNKDIANLPGYILRVALLQKYMFLRETKYARTHITSLEQTSEGSEELLKTELFRDFTPGPEEIVESKERFERVQQRFEGLTADQQLTIQAYLDAEAEGRTIEDLAGDLHMTGNALRGRLLRIRNMLIRGVEEYDQET